MDRNQIIGMDNTGQQGQGEDLNNAEQIFFNLLDDERLFNRDKFYKALKQEKLRRV